MVLLVFKGPTTVFPASTPVFPSGTPVFTRIYPYFLEVATVFPTHGRILTWGTTVFTRTEGVQKAYVPVRGPSFDPMFPTCPANPPQAALNRDFVVGCVRISDSFR